MAKVKRVRRKENEAESSLSLPTDPNVPPDDLLSYVVALYGVKGIGKTSLSAQFPNSLTFMFEPGRRNLPIMQVPENPKDQLRWSDFLDYRDLFLKSDFDSAAIDTLDRCYMSCFDHVCRTKGVKHPQALGREAFSVWDQIADTFEDGLRPLLASGKGLILLSHDKKRTTELNTGEVLEMIEPSCKPAAYRFIQTVVDFVFYYTWVGGGRALIVRDPSGYVWCSCGLESKFRNPDGSPINTFRLSSESPAQAYEDLLHTYDNEGQDLEYKPERPKKRLPRKLK